MNKIPVGKTIRSAYAFAFGHLGSIIGLVWAPLVLIAVLQFLPYAMGYESGAMPENATIAGQRALLGLGSSLLIVLLQAMMTVAVTQFALGLRPGGAIFHIALGPPELRVFGAILLLAVVLICMAFAIVVAGVIFGGIAGATAGKPAAIALVAALVVIAMGCAFIFVALRLAFFLLPVTVAEQHINLGRGWTLTHGNFWRIVAIVVATTVPVALVHFAIVVWLVGPHQLFLPLPWGNEQAMDVALRNRFAGLDQHMPLYIGLVLIIAPFGIGLNLGAAAAAYRFLTQQRPQEPAAA